MEVTGEKEGDPMVLGIPLPDMGTSEHGYGLIMKALYKRAVTGEGSCINMSMFESSLSWMTVPFTLTSVGRTISRRGNTHEFFAPLSVYKTRDGYVYVAVGNDRQWKSMVSQEIFTSLDKPEYETNKGRIEDVKNLNRSIVAITQNHTSEELIELFNSITVPISKINTVPEVMEEPLAKKVLLSSVDPKSGAKIIMPPSPNMTPFLEEMDRKLPFPPRFGEHNNEIYGQVLGYSEEKINQMREEKII